MPAGWNYSSRSPQTRHKTRNVKMVSNRIGFSPSPVSGITSDLLALFASVVEWLVVSPRGVGVRDAESKREIFRHSQPLIPSPSPACGRREQQRNALFLAHTLPHGCEGLLDSGQTAVFYLGKSSFAQPSCPNFFNVSIFTSAILSASGKASTARSTLSSRSRCSVG